jgi:hypothetical protein
MLVAVTVKVPPVLPAVKTPAEIVPPVADQVTPVFELPVTVAENGFVLPDCKEAEAGLIVTATDGVPGFPVEPVEPVQLTKLSVVRITHKMLASLRIQFCPWQTAAFFCTSQHSKRTWLFLRVHRLAPMDCGFYWPEGRIWHTGSEVREEKKTVESSVGSGSAIIPCSQPGRDIRKRT